MGFMHVTCRGESTEGVDLDYYRTRIGVSIELSKQAASELS